MIDLETKADRRIRITKRMLHETLIELLQTQRISDLSVKKICEAADLNRSTFYAHYQNPMELLQEIEDETYEQLNQYIIEKTHGNSEATHRTTMTHAMEYVKENPELFKVLLGTNGSGRFLQDILSLTGDFSNKQKGQKQSKNHYIQLYYMAGWVAVVEDWLNNGCLESPQEISTIVAKLINNATFR